MPDCPDISSNNKYQKLQSSKSSINSANSSPTFDFEMLKSSSVNSSDDDSAYSSLKGEEQLSEKKKPIPSPPLSTSYITDNDITLDTNELIKTVKAKMDAKVHFQSDDLQIRVLGVPLINAKSRVETQIKLCIQLLTKKGEKSQLKCSHLKLPEHLVSKEKVKKQRQNEVECVSSLLELEAIVVCVSDVDKSVKTCLGCVQRERKRSKKRESTKIKKGSDEDCDRMDDDTELEAEQSRIIIFNCAQYLDFSNGDTFLPTRITCYCRHHAEKIGFWDHSKNIIATGLSPPILITDDHKSNKPKIMKKPSSLSAKKSNNINKNNSCNSLNEASLPNNFKINNQNILGLKLMEEILNNNQQQTDLSGSSSSNVFENCNPYLSPPNYRFDNSQLLHNQQNVFSTSNDGNLKNRKRQRNSITGGNGDFSNDNQQLMLEDFLDFPLSPASENNSVFNAANFSTPANLIFQQQPNMVVRIPKPPNISKVIPAEGPIHGGLEITILGSDFFDGLTVLFGDIPALTTFWSQNTLVCVLPPSSVPGAVKVSFKELSIIENENLTFTYKDETERALLELALQVVGLRMTGKIDDPRQIAMKIVNDTSNSTTTQRISNENYQQEASMVEEFKTTLNLQNMQRNELEESILESLRATSSIYELNYSQQSTGLNLLMLSIILGYDKLAAFLIAKKANLEHRDLNGNNCLIYSVMFQRHLISDVLLKAGVNKITKNFFGKDAADVALDYKNLKFLELLEDPKVDTPSIEKFDMEIKEDIKEQKNAKNLIEVTKKVAGIPQHWFPQIPHFPDVTFPQMPNVTFPQMPNVTFPQMPNVTFPQMPNPYVWWNGFQFQLRHGYAQPQQIQSTAQSNIPPNMNNTASHDIPKEHKMPSRLHRIFNKIRPSSSWSRVCDCGICGRCRENIAKRRLANRSQTQSVDNKLDSQETFTFTLFKFIFVLILLALLHYTVTVYEDVIFGFVETFINVGELRNYFATARPGQLLPGVPVRGF
ncbi:SPT3 Dosage dependent suppressor of Ty-induced promoter mutations-like protein [Lobulomyces angularis]|nr:SPT3 Dosage dependent suppressor of Ty-induced promoter mutations-like protein [Lobulomyces angularis]